MKKLLSVLTSFTIVATAFVGCSRSYKEVEQEPVVVESNGFTINYFDADIDDNAIDLHTSRMEAFLDGDCNKIKKFGQGVEPNDKINVIEYHYDDDFVLHISKNEDMSDGFLVYSEKGIAFVENLEVGTTYYVQALINDSEIVKLDNIVTADCTPRVINVEGVKNVRDLGGWKTADGGRVKQGLLFRCGRLNESDTDSVNIEITDEGKSVMLNRLGIKTEIDLRVVENHETGMITSSPLGYGVNYMSFPMSYANDFYLDSKPLVRDVFKVLANQSNYPIIFHCNIGTDRTGMIAYMVNGLLGVDEEDLFYDYVYSNFADIGGSRSIKGLKNHSYYKEIQNQKGDTLSEKIHNQLLELGVTEEEIQSIISIMKE